ncbi:MAG: N-formylglutamate amidohydrolase [Spirochaetales bacterium]|nr:N-formylglutamate amidohydrolase [Spirochaetales bacterium]
MNCNLILNIPHASDYIPEDCFPKDSEEFRILKEDQINMVDWYTDELFNNGIGVPVIAPVSRMVCDTERFRNDEDEPMSRIGMGVCYETTSDLKHRFHISKEHREHVIRNYYDVHHRALELAVARAIASRGHEVIMDCHSFSPVPLPYEQDQNTNRPDICIGRDFLHTPGQIDEWSRDFFRRRGYKVSINRPYSGTIMPMKYYHKVKVLSLMVEVNRGLYLKEGTNEKNEYFPTLQKHLKEFQEYVLRKFVEPRLLHLGLAKADDPLFDHPLFISTMRRVSDFTGK